MSSSSTMMTIQNFCPECMASACGLQKALRKRLTPMLTAASLQAEVRRDRTFSHAALAPAISSDGWYAAMHHKQLATWLMPFC